MCYRPLRKIVELDWIYARLYYRAQETELKVYVSNNIFAIALEC